MDTSEPSTNGTSASNLYRLSSILNEPAYSELAKRTIEAFESEILQYPWLFGSFMPAIIAGRLGVKTVVISGDGDVVEKHLAKLRMRARGGLDTVVKVSAGGWVASRNNLLKDFKGERVMVCENGVCRELVEGEFDLKDVADALPR